MVPIATGGPACTFHDLNRPARSPLLCGAGIMSRELPRPPLFPPGSLSLAASVSDIPATWNSKRIVTTLVNDLSGAHERRSLQVISSTVLTLRRPYP